jgi:pilus assembly protein Flp/PilA
LKRNKGKDMKKLMTIARQFRDDEEGAAMIEYTVLIGLITAGVILMIVAVGGWVTTEWTALNTTLQAN